MKSDLDQILEDNNIDALWVTGPGFNNPVMVYLTGGGHLTAADLILKRGQPPLLFHTAMEREEAARTGLNTRSYGSYPLKELLEEAGGDYEQAMALRLAKMFTDAGVTGGRVAVYGHAEVGPVVGALPRLRDLLPEVTFVGFSRDPILMRAMMTKDKDEVERIRQVGVKTTQVVDKVANYLTSRPVNSDEVLLREDGQPLTVGDVKAKINLWCAEAGLENPEPYIFAIGRDGAIPHSSGNPADVIRLGSPIVFDIFPVEAGGGYFHDFTRTWCLGYAPSEAKHIYDQVLTVYRQIVSELEVNAPFRRYQERTCEMFEEMGHPTIASDPNTENGYVHSLGHGVGLHIHEKPFCGANADAMDILAPGSVVAIEPGLYYPGRGIGVRLENTFWVTPEGRFESLTDYPMDLVLPMKS